MASHRKRAFVAGSNDQEEEEQPPSRRQRGSGTSSGSSSRTTTRDMEVETLRAELEHERTLRSLDQKRFTQSQQRLEQQVEFAVEESHEAKAMMDELQATSQQHIEQLRDARQQAQEDLRDVQAQLDEERLEHEEQQQRESSAYSDENEDEDDNSDNGMNHPNKKASMLQNQLEAQRDENEDLQKQLSSLRDELKRVMEEHQHDSQQLKKETEEDNVDLKQGASSMARPAVLKELTKVRIQLAEAERKNRQLSRTNDDLHGQSRLLTQERETSRSATQRMQQLETKTRELSKTYETSLQEVSAWKEFGRRFLQLLEDNTEQNSSSYKATTTNDRNINVPPEISVVQRFVSQAMQAANDANAQVNVYQTKLETSETRIQSLEMLSRESDRKEESVAKETKDLERRTRVAEKQASLLKGQERVFEREIASLRSIVEAFDTLPLAGKKQGSSGSVSDSNNMSTSVSSSSSVLKVMETRLKAADDELDVWKKGQMEMKNELDSTLKEKRELQKTHNTVMEKFGKLRDAVYAERTKASKAEERAIRAEQLAGKGAFNPDTTRVLHMSNNPLVEAFKEEVSVLKRQVKTLQSRQLEKEQALSSAQDKSLPSLTGSNNNNNNNPDVDPNKLHQRLKQSFKEQIGRFREGVYLLTGFKVDMIPEGDRPKFKVRSVFAEQEQDHLVFQWPEGRNVSSLDLLDTDLAKLLATTDSFQYVQRFHSIPAFLASVQLGLFEKTTMVS